MSAIVSAYVKRGKNELDVLEGNVRHPSRWRCVVIEHRWRYGYRRVTAELRAQGMLVNHKHIARLTREDNLLDVRQEWFGPVERSLRASRIYLNLASRMTLLGPNQLWAADITYESKSEFGQNANDGKSHLAEQKCTRRLVHRKVTTACP